MDERPREPADESLQLQAAQVGNGRPAADRRHVAKIVVVKPGQGLMLDGPLDVPGSVLAHLDRDLRDAG